MEVVMKNFLIVTLAMIARLVLSTALALSILASASSGQDASRERSVRPTFEDDRETGHAVITQEKLRERLHFIASEARGGRATFSKGLDEAAEFIVAQLKRFGCEPAGDDGTFFQTFSFSKGEASVTSRNVVAILPGSDPQLKDEIVAFCAHYDHLGKWTLGMHGGGTQSTLGAWGDANPIIFNRRFSDESAKRFGVALHLGADDNASGTVGILGVAEALAAVKRPRRSVLFLWPAGEEIGLMGSKHFVAHPVRPLDKFVALVNVDMIGRDYQDKAANAQHLFFLAGPRGSLELDEIVHGAVRDRMRLDENDPQNYFGRSDHVAFAEHYVPVAHFTTGTHRDYHKRTDTSQMIRFEKLETVTEILFDLGLELANGGTRPPRGDGVDTIPRFVQGLSREDPHPRAVAARALGSFGAKQAAETVPPLSTLLEDKAPEVRVAALRALAEIGPDARLAAPSIVALMKDSESSVRQQVPETLGKLGSAAKDAVPALVAALEDPDKGVQAAATYAIGQIGRAAGARALALAAARGDPSQRFPNGTPPAVAVLDSLGRPAAEAVPTLLKLLKDDQLRHEATQVLLRLRYFPPSTAPALRELLKHPDAELRIAGARGLWRLERKADDVMPVLMAVFHDTQLTNAVRARAVGALGALGPAAEAMVPALVDAMLDRNKPTYEGLRPSIISTLGKIGPAAEPAIPLLIEALGERHNWRNDPTSKVSALAKIGSAAIEPLVQALGHENANVRQGAVLALGELGEPAALRALPQIVDRLRNDPNSSVGMAAAETVNYFGWAAESAAPDLIEVMRSHKDRTVRGWTAKALGSVRPDPSLALPALVEALDDQATYGGALEAFQTLGPAAEPAVGPLLEKVSTAEGAAQDALFRALLCMGPEGRRAVVRTAIEMLKGDAVARYDSALIFLSEAGPESEPAVAALMTILDQKDLPPVTRVQAANALGRIGPAAIAALPALREAMDGPDSQLRFHAAEALWRVAPDARTVVPLFAELLEDPTIQLKNYDANKAGKAEVARVLGEIGPAAAETAPALVKLLDHDDLATRVEAAHALVRLGRAADGVPVLRQELEATDNLWRRLPIAIALSSTDSERQDSVAILTDLLKSFRKTSYYYAHASSAARALGELGPAARDAVAVLTEATRDRYWQVREAATDALQKIDPEAAAKARAR
jgi:HEAT repeat protein